ncbi:MAG: EamA family transporter [Candidatus Aenigmarchaeota archaeon]|nr:EamA family transporter [Candidatus Aenigmarchaeota archaeon]
MFSFWPLLAGFIFVLRLSTYYHALNLINIKEVALFAIISPIITFAYSFLLFGETLNLIQIVGVLMVFLGIYIHVVMKSKIQKNEPKQNMV